MTSRSDLYTDKELQDEQDRSKNERKKLVDRITAAIHTRGLSEVLADIVECGHVRP